MIKKFFLDRIACPQASPNRLYPYCETIFLALAREHSL
jgi:hypothetical protein